MDWKGRFVGNIWKSHKDECGLLFYPLRAHLHPRIITSPPIWREIYFPAGTKFQELHQALMVAFGWEYTHTPRRGSSYVFNVFENKEAEKFDMQKPPFENPKPTLEIGPRRWSHVEFDLIAGSIDGVMPSMSFGLPSADFTNSGPQMMTNPFFGRPYRLSRISNFEIDPSIDVLTIADQSPTMGNYELSIRAQATGAGTVPPTATPPRNPSASSDSHTSLLTRKTAASVTPPLQPAIYSNGTPDGAMPLTMPSSQPSFVSRGINPSLQSPIANVLPSTPEFKYSSNATLFEVLKDPMKKKTTIIYKYYNGFDVPWEHVITCSVWTSALSGLLFKCTKGQGHGAAETVYGAVGWNILLEAYDAENPTQLQMEQRKWFETKALAGLSKDLRISWPRDETNLVLRQLAEAYRWVCRSQKLGKCKVILISLDEQPDFYSRYSTVIQKLDEQGNLFISTHIASVSAFLNKLDPFQNIRDTQPHRFQAIILTDPAIMYTKCFLLHQRIKSYAKEGGTVIFGFDFGWRASAPMLMVYLRDKWGLGWRMGQSRNNHSRPPKFVLSERKDALFRAREKKSQSNGNNDASQTSSEPPFKFPRCSKLPSKYSVKACSLLGTKQEQRIYVSSHRREQGCPFVLTEYGKGYVGWIGDCSQKEWDHTTIEILLMMCQV
jgi:hypothetical protein